VTKSKFLSVFNFSLDSHKSVSTTMKYIGITPKMTEKAMTQIESTSSLQMPQKWKKPATLADLIK
jgi:hypothetical protein